MATGNHTIIEDALTQTAFNAEEAEAVIDFIHAFIEKADQEEIERLGDQMETDTIRKLQTMVEATL